MTFLKDQVIGRKSTGSSSSFVEALDNENCSTNTEVNEESESLFSAAGETPLSQQRAMPRKRKPAEDELQHKMLALEEKKIKLIEDEASNKDDVFLFLSSLAPSLRAMEPRTRSYVKLKMMELIHNIQFPEPSNVIYECNPACLPNHGNSFYSS